jgi:prophage regulatory protein
VSQPNKERFVGPSAVAARLGVCVGTLHRMVKRGRFPAPIRYSQKLLRWPEAVVDAWIEAEKQKAEGA